MTITESTFLYEVLLRFDASGLVGSHAIEMQRVLGDGAVLVEKALPARPVAPEEFPALLKTRVGVSAALISKMEQEAQTRDAELNRLRAELKAAQSELRTLKDAANAVDSRLQQEVAQAVVSEA